jgi:hypothetical protein
MMKKLLIVPIMLGVIFGFTACGHTDNSTQPTNKSTQSVPPNPVVTPKPIPTHPFYTHGPIFRDKNK